MASSASDAISGLEVVPLTLQMEPIGREENRRIWREKAEKPVQRLKQNQKKAL